ASAIMLRPRNLPPLIPFVMVPLMKILIGLSLLTLPLSADVSLPAIFGNGMVVQRDAPIRVWGTADPNEAVSITFNRMKASGTANAEGNWLLEIPAQKADGKSHQLEVKGKNTITLTDVLIGDLWIGSGQSNMEWSLTQSGRKDEFIKAANHPNIRLFHIPKVRKPAPQTDVNASWKTCTSENIPRFSAVLYHFGKTIQEKVDVPLGLINSSWGGSPIEPWTITSKSSGDIYNAMIAPITNLSIKGVIWYQGETNVIQKNGLGYTGKMKDLIDGWRGVFRNESMPFYFVQLAPWGNPRYADGQLPAVWEAQVATLKIPNTGMAVTTDIVHNIGDIHPKNKHDVGDRLARWALVKDYGVKDLPYSGPLYKSMKVEGDKIRISFAHGKGLKSRDGKDLNEFKISGADGNFVEAQAKIDGDSVLVSAEGVKAPAHVQFGWHRSANPNLMNNAGLPASPFQTNNWTGGTGE
ncbi:MAG: sialate O-acetylesterase, partial [Akkermansiaceae bacterium]